MILTLECSQIYDPTSMSISAACCWTAEFDGESKNISHIRDCPKSRVKIPIFTSDLGFFTPPDKTAMKQTVADLN